MLPLTLMGCITEQKHGLFNAEIHPNLQDQNNPVMKIIKEDPPSIPNS